MSNHRTRTVNYTPRYTYWQPLALLPPELRLALNDAWFSWDAGWALREYRKAASRLGHAQAVSLVQRALVAGDQHEARKPITNARGAPFLSAFATFDLDDLL